MKTSFFTVLTFLFFLSSCETFFDVDFKIANQTNETIEVISFTYTENDTFQISQNNEILISNQSSIGEPNEEYYALLDSIPIRSLSIKMGQQFYNKNAKDKSLWEFDGEVSILKVVEGDFD